MTIYRFILPLLLVAAAACGAKTAPAVAPAPPAAAKPGPAAPGPVPAAPSTALTDAEAIRASAPHLTSRVAAACEAAGCTPADRLRGELEALFAVPFLQHAVWSVLVQSLDTGETLYALNPDTMVVPASNMKIVSTALAASRLGWDYRYETRLETAGRVGGGVLRGDLIVAGGGDPTINAHFTAPDAVFDAWAAALRAEGITRVAGRIIGDDDRFEVDRLGDGWAWDDTAYGYSAPTGALQINENVVEMTVAPGAAEGAPASVAIAAPWSDLVVVNRLTTGPTGSRPAWSYTRFPASRELVITGVVPAGAEPFTRQVAVDNPTLVFARALKHGLGARGILVEGEAVDIDDIDAARSPDSARSTRVAGSANPLAAGTGRRVIARHQSPPLAELSKRLMKVSQNLYAETVFHTLSASPGPASVEASREAAEEGLARWGLTPRELRMADGSGLSRQNLVSARAIVAILRAMARDARLADAFEASMPVGGRDGTLASRFKGTRAEDNLKAKTGSLRNVRALSGYLRTASGERIVFSAIANHFTTPTSAVDAVVDLAMERLAAFAR